jgi:hypothetical protein
VGSEAAAFGTVTRLLSPNVVAGDADVTAEGVPFIPAVMPVDEGVDTADRDPTRLGVRRCAGAGTVTRAEDAAGALLGESPVLAAAGDDVRDESAGAAEDTGVELASAVMPAFALDEIGCAGAFGPPARDSTRRA